MKKTKTIKRAALIDLSYLNYKPLMKLKAKPLTNKLVSVVVMFLLTVSQFSCQTSRVTGTADKNTAAPSPGFFPYKSTALSETLKEGWPLMDLESDSIPGISLRKASVLVKDKESSPVVTAIIDSGVDIDHAALKAYVWHNKDEIPSNHQDDDGNGYVDDVSGWNFLGDIYYAPLAMTRMVAKGNGRFSGKALGDLTLDERREFEHYQEAKAAYDKKSQEITDVLKKYASAYDDAPKQFRKYYEYLKVQNDYHYNLDFDPRKDLGDKINDLTDKQYGNNNVNPIHEKETHGTHVAGIFTKIVGKLPNANITFMPIRNTPNGDEYDKDVVLAIRYAVDNGAKVINMNFGKPYSEYPDWVYDAIKYAASKDVLIVHAAGNSGADVDSVMVYPNDHRGTTSEIADNFISVGAITRYYNEVLIPSFTNYGGRNVDIFAPGEDVYAALPGDSYGYERGTSMAAPMVSAVAALVRSYYPGLSSGQVKKIIMDSGVEVPFDVWVEREDEVLEARPFTELCQSGRILNAYEALLMAEKVSNQQAFE